MSCVGESTLVLTYLKKGSLQLFVMFLLMKSAVSVSDWTNLMHSADTDGQAKQTGATSMLSTARYAVV